MSEDWHERRPKRRRHHKRKHGRRRRERDYRSEEYDEIDEALLSPEERALRKARRAADAKVELAGDALKFGAITLLLLIFLPPVGIIVLIFWGAGYLKQAYRLVIEPRLRERFPGVDVLPPGDELVPPGRGQPPHEQVAQQRDGPGSQPPGEGEPAGRSRLGLAHEAEPRRGAGAAENTAPEATTRRAAGSRGEASSSAR